MLKIFVKTALVLLLGTLLTPISTARAADVSVTLALFHDRLAPYGEWVSVNRYGSCWRPRHIARDWRPYTVGRWVYSDYGWTWVSDESWGWATYHYGRWVDDPDYGWIWVPDETWGPAYVSWRYGDGWIGWAPLPPGISLGAAVEIDRYVRPSAYAFVQAQYFPDPQIRTHIVTGARNGSLIPVTRNVTRYESGGGRIVDRGVDPREVERASGHRMVRLQVRDTSDPRPSRARVANNQLMVYRPSAANREAARPSAQPGPHGSREPAIQPRAQAQRRGEPPNRARGTSGHVVPEPRAEQPQRRAQPQPDRHAQAARRQTPAPRHQPAPVATRGRRASKPSAAPKPNPRPENNAGRQKDKKKKKGGS
jgi:hypothetical protein